jgi:poly(beta-D-mannuronate) lyase
VYQPELNSFADRWFRLNDTRDGVVFTANAGGVTTKNSGYPRSELREMNGSEKASWSNTNGTHTLRLRQAVTELPAVKPQVVTAQIHDAEDDVIEVRVEGEQLLVEYDDGDSVVTLDPGYVLGTPYDLEIIAAGGRIRVSYNGAQKADIIKSGSGWYFKTGTYVQSNLLSGEAADAVGQVVLHSLDVRHAS